ncbi:MAG: hypothetical protein IKV40_06280, partial [Clostridia bacterium]|nr:hypothetical protein [Clostridia bacterium]
MKKKLNRIISVILLFASLISVLSVFAYASEAPAASESQTALETEEDTEVDLSQIDLIYNRNFEEGWNYNNGFSTLKTHKAYIDYEETATYKYNYFWRMEASSSTAAEATTLNIGALRESGSVVQFKIKVDDACNLGRIMYITTPGKKTIDLLYITGNTLYAFKSGNPGCKIADLTNEWLSVAFVFDWDAYKELPDGSTDTLFKCTVYYGDE